MGWVKRLIDTIIQDRMGHSDLEFAWSDKRPVDPADQEKILTGYAARGIMTVNECRDILGLDPIAGGDIATIDVAGQGPVPVAQLGQLPDTDKEEVGKRADRPFAHPATSPARLRAAGKLKAAIGTFFNTEAPRVAGEVYRSRKLVKADDDTDNDDDADHDDQVKPDQDRHRLEAAILAALLAIDFSRWRVLIAPVAAVLSDLGSDVFDDTLAAVGAADRAGAVWIGRAPWRRYAPPRWSAANGSATRPSRTDAEAAITESTKSMLRPAIERAIKEKLTQAEFAAELAASVFSKARADRIADFETKNVFHQATLEAFKQSGKVDSVRWVTMRDGRVEEICAANEDVGPIALGDTFPSGDTAPPAHGNCRCSLEAITS